MRKHKIPGDRGRISILAGISALALLMAGCSLEVDNPTQIEDADLTSAEAVSALVAGTAGDFAEAMVVPGGGGLYNAGAMLTDELVHVGTWIGLRGLSDGVSYDDWVESQSRWAEPSQARWVAEDAIVRISQILEEQGEDPNSSPAVAEVTMWAGHANRALGDHFCHAVLTERQEDGSYTSTGLLPHTAFYERAEQHFTEAITLAAAAGREDLKLSALGGRAHTRMMLGDWEGAVADASRIPTDFVFLQIHADPNGVPNQFRWWGYNRNESSVWGTPFEEWGLNLSDPDSPGDSRVPFDVAMTEDGEVAKGGDNRRPFYRQLKWDDYGDDIPVVEGTAMRLIEAEAALVNSGDVVTVVAKINEVRQLHNAQNGWDLPMVSASTVDEAWTLLMKERGLELWLQGKRLPDLRRWAEVPGEVPFRVVREANSGQPASADPRLPVLQTQVMQEAGDLCIKVSKDEKNSNPNI